MRIGLVIYGRLDTQSGGYLYDRQLVQRLQVGGHSVDVISQPWSRYAGHLLHNLDRQWAERMAGEYHVLLQDELNHPSLFSINRGLKRRSSVPLVSIVHHLRSSEDHPRALRWFYHLVERAYLRSVDGFIFNSQTTKTAVERMAGDLSKPWVVATPAGNRFGPGIADDEIIARVNGGKILRVLFVGNVIRRKGLHSLLRALAELPDDAWQLTVAGRLDVDASYAQALIEQARRSGTVDRVQFVGGLDDAQLRERLMSNDVLAVPSQYEGFGIVYLEGMAYGLPGIATTSGAAGEIIQDGQSGFLVQVGDWRALSQRLRQLAGDRDRLRGMSLAARRRFDDFPGWEESMGKIVGFLDQFV